MVYKVEATTIAESALDAIRPFDRAQIVVIRNLLDDDDADDLIAMHPEFQQSIRNARRQKAAGLVRSLADLRQKYALEEEHDSDLPAGETLG